MIITIQPLGKRKAPVDEWEFTPPPEVLDPGGDGGMTLRQLLSRIVRDEVRKFHRRQKERMLVHVLTPGQIARAAAAGKVSMGQQEGGPQKVDPEAAVAIALQAFEDGLYLAFIDDAEQRDLDAQVRVNEDSRLVFLQLTFLAGA
ncbi:hypothetical protein DB346_01545 [Verrucomicrobia bacterium LW23]|nr:hypothetical protein DB346_01545 [Verrucomicrobia bacterium LW23]